AVPTSAYVSNGPVCARPSGAASGPAGEAAGDDGVGNGFGTAPVEAHAVESAASTIRVHFIGGAYRRERHSSTGSAKRHVTKDWSVSNLEPPSGHGQNFSAGIFSPID